MSKIKRTIGIVDQVRVALSRQHRLATAIGALLGAAVPVSTFALMHQEIPPEWYTEPRTLIVLGGLIYSALTVYRWGRMAFNSTVKAVGFTVLLEGVMTLSSQGWLSAMALGYLCAINAIATGVTLAQGASQGGETPALRRRVTR